MLWALPSEWAPNRHHPGFVRDHDGMRIWLWVLAVLGHPWCCVPD